MPSLGKLELALPRERGLRTDSLNANPDLSLLSHTSPLPGLYTHAEIFSQPWRIDGAEDSVVCDSCGKEVDEGKGAVARVNFTDARRGSKQADLCDDCAGKMPGQNVARRGRRPKAKSA